MPTKSISTQAQVEKAKPADHRIEIRDKRQPNLYLTIQPSGRKSWCVRYRIGRKSRKLTIPYCTLAVARKEAQKALDAVATGRDPMAEKKAKRNAVGTTVADVIAEFLKRHTRKRKGTPIRASTRRETGRLLGFAPVTDDLTEWKPRENGALSKWLKQDIKTISRSDVDDLIKAAAKAAPVGTNRLLTALKLFFKWAEKQQYIEKNPAGTVDPPSPEEPSGRSLKDDEIAKLWRTAEKHGRFGQFVRFLLLSGQRRGELLACTWSDIDLTKATWTIPAHVAKNGNEHVVPLSQPMLDILDTLDPKKGQLFSLPSTNITRHKRTLDEDAGVSGYRLHDFRHTCRTFLVEQRIPLDVRNATQNHVTGGMESVYSHHDYLNEKRDALARWADHILSRAEKRA